MRRSTNPRGTVREEKSLYCNLEELISFLTEKGVTDFSKVDFNCYDDYAFVEFHRPETDAEMNKRIDKERRAFDAMKAKKAEEKARKEEQDLKEYERLKRKFESK